MLPVYGWRPGIVALLAARCCPGSDSPGATDEFRPTNARPDPQPANRDMNGAFRSPIFLGIGPCLVFTAAGMYAIVVQSVPFLVDMGSAMAGSGPAFGDDGRPVRWLAMARVEALSDRFGYRRSAIASFALGTAVGIVLARCAPVFRWNGVLIRLL